LPDAEFVFGNLDWEGERTRLKDLRTIMIKNAMFVQEALAFSE
jgi:hypothetical protein